MGQTNGWLPEQPVPGGVAFLKHRRYREMSVALCFTRVTFSMRRDASTLKSTYIPLCLLRSRLQTCSRLRTSRQMSDIGRSLTAKLLCESVLQ